MAPKKKSKIDLSHLRTLVQLETEPTPLTKEDVNVSLALSHRQTPPELSATSASAGPAATVVHDLPVLFEGTNPTVEYALRPVRLSHRRPDSSIVAVHGLNRHYEKTWMASNGVNWLCDLLLHDLPNARILSWGYDANTHSSSRVSTQYLYDHGRELVSDLCLEREVTKVGEEQDATHDTRG
jgi:hypothetical protein